MFTLELIFLNEDGKTVKINVDHPKPDLTSEEIEGVMDEILTAGVFTSTGGDYVSKVGARIIERNVTEIEFA